MPHRAAFAIISPSKNSNIGHLASRMWEDMLVEAINHNSAERAETPAQLSVRVLQQSDLQSALRLTKLAGWNQTPRDWQRFLSANPDGNFAAMRDGKIVGTAATIRYENRIAWISMVLVDPESRRMGIGRMLLQSAIESLADVACIKLDATPAGKKLYDTLGFRDESTLQRWTCASVCVSNQAGSTPGVRHATLDDLAAIVELDAQTFGAERKFLLQSLLEDSSRVWRFAGDGENVAFCLGREGAHFFQIGPVVAESFEQARWLMMAALQTLNGRAVLVDVPDSQAELATWLEEIGFVSQRPFIRMRRGEEACGTQTHRLFAICGPEFG